MIFLKKFNFLIILIFILSSCVSLPGINKSPDKKKVNKKKDISQYTIEDVGINIINISIKIFELATENKIVWRQTTKCF